MQRRDSIAVLAVLAVAACCSTVEAALQRSDAPAPAPEAAIEAPAIDAGQTSALGPTSSLQDLALNRPAGASSTFDRQTGAEKAVDGDTSTGWYPPNATYPEWLVVKLQGLSTLRRVDLVFGGSGTYGFKVQASNVNVPDPADNGDKRWFDLVDASAGLAVVAGEAVALQVKGEFRYVRVLFEWALEPGLAAGLVTLAMLGEPLQQPRGVVAPPVPLVKEGNSTVMMGMQMCNIFDQFGWKVMQPFPERRPLMGYYDDAYDITVDTTIKLLVDHGVDFVSMCWYRMRGNAGYSPVLSSYDQLLDSLMHSAEHRASIQWAGLYVPRVGDVTGLDDFVDNLVPFWVEEWFSLDNYLKVDGKPVLAFFFLPQLIEDLGGPENLQAGLDALQAATEAAGHPGLVLLASKHYNITETNADMADYGFDAVFSYQLPNFLTNDNWHKGNSTPDPTLAADAQRRAWETVAESSVVAPIASVTVGWNSTPWGEMHSTLKWRVDPLEWGELVRDAVDFASQQPDTSLGSRMVWLSSWDEWAEGHYLSCTELEGCAYLDQLAQVLAAPGVRPPPEFLPNVTAIPQLLEAEEEEAAAAQELTSEGI